MSIPLKRFSLYYLKELEARTVDVSGWLNMGNRCRECVADYSQEHEFGWLHSGKECVVMVDGKNRKTRCRRSCCHNKGTLSEVLNSYMQSREAPSVSSVANQDREMGRIRHHILM